MSPRTPQRASQGKARPAARRPAERKPAARRGESSRASARKPAERRPATRPRRSSAAKAAPALPSLPKFTRPAWLPSLDLWRNLSLDRKLDLAGVVLAITGLLSLLSLLSTNRSSITGAWLWMLQSTFGYGAYVLPVALLLLGLWLVLRNFERIPVPSLERLIGSLLIYLNLLVWLHWFSAPASQAISLALAANGQGGGYLGAVLFELLRYALGSTGTAFVLVGWLLLALAFSLDESVLGLFRWATPGISAVQTRLNSLGQRVAQAGAARLSHDLPPGYQPLPPGQRPVEVLSAEHPGSALQVPAGLPPAAAVTSGIPASSRITPVWSLPSIVDLLDTPKNGEVDPGLDEQRARLIEDTLASFGAPAHVVETNRGPTITQYGVEPDYVETRAGRTRVRVGKIAALADDLALALAARRIRIQAPVPGKGFIGIEVPNEKPNLVTMRGVLESDSFKRLKGALRFALGQDVAGGAAAVDLSNMPHLLIAGATGSGKSVCVNGIIACFLINNTPDDLRLIMVDPKRVELTGYNGIPHLLAPVVTDLERVVGALQWILREMDQRYHKFAAIGARNIGDFNARQVAKGEKKLPYLVVIIDELADLMMLAPDDTERSITRLAQLARATGIHLIIATQRPSVDVVTGLIKANFPARIAFAVASGVDSRVILDQPGAERLLGMGDMLFQAPDAPAPVRLQGVYVSDGELQRLVEFWRMQAGQPASAPMATGGVVDSAPAGVPLKQIPLWEEFEAKEDQDPLLDEAVDLVRRQGRASISMLQRRLRIGYTRAARLIELMEEKGIVGAPESAAGTRQVLDYGQAAPPVDEAAD